MASVYKLPIARVEFQELPNTMAFHCICSKNHIAECILMGPNPATLTRQTNRVTVLNDHHVKLRTIQAPDSPLQKSFGKANVQNCSRHDWRTQAIFAILSSSISKKIQM